MGAGDIKTQLQFRVALDLVEDRTPDAPVGAPHRNYAYAFQTVLTKVTIKPKSAIVPVIYQILNWHYVVQMIGI